jgi:stage III sporulation protein AB
VLIKGLAVGLIVFSTGMMGMLIAQSFAHQVQNLRQLITFIQVLESEIQFARTTLPDVILAQAKQCSGDVGTFLGILSTTLQAGTGEPLGVIWGKGLETLSANGFPRAVLEDMRTLGDVLGTSDVSEQVKHLRVLLHRLEQALKLAEEQRDKQTRLWKYLGFSAGLLICLLLL